MKAQEALADLRQSAESLGFATQDVSFYPGAWSMQAANGGREVYYVCNNEDGVPQIVVLNLGKFPGAEFNQKVKE